MVNASSVSRRGLALGRVVDQLAAVPGRYVIVLTVPAHTRRNWTVEFGKFEVSGRQWLEGEEVGRLSEVNDDVR